MTNCWLQKINLKNFLDLKVVHRGAILEVSITAYGPNFATLPLHIVLGFVGISFGDRLLGQ